MIHKRHSRVKTENVVMRKLLVILGIMLLIGSLTMGCDDSVLEGLADDDSFEAKLEEARIALDKGEYANAVSLLEALYSLNIGNETILEYLSNAYAGLAGLDTFNLLTTIEALDDSDNSGSIDMMGLVFGDSDGNLTAAQIADKLEDIERAMTALEGLSSQNNDQTVQLGLLAVAHMSLTVGNVVSTDQGGADVSLTEEGLGALYSDSQPAEFSGDVSSGTLDRLTTDLGYVAAAVTALNNISGQGNDLSEDFSQFQNDIDNDGDDGSVSQTDLENYINNQI